MVICHMLQDDGIWISVFGLSRQTVNDLIAGEAVHITEAAHGDACPEHAEIVIMFGETDGDLKLSVLKLATERGVPVEDIEDYTEH